MGARWRILGALTLARTALGFQFQVVTASGAGLTADLALSNAALGFLIGLYLLPGVALAIPGGWLGQRFGDKRAVMAGLALMALGALMSVSGGGWPVVLAGRLVAGIGGVLLNVLVAKMVADWFAGRELPFAMGVLLVSWPLGIALAMVTLPALTMAVGWEAAFLTTVVTSLLCFAVVWTAYRPAPAATAAAGPPTLRLPRAELGMSLLAGLVWAFYNAALVAVLSFGPGFLEAEGADPVAAQATASAVGWLILPTLATAGWVAGRLDRPTLVLAGGLSVTAALVFLLPPSGGSLALFAAIGLIFGLPGGVLMTLPVEAAAPSRRGVAFGIFFSLNYLGMAFIGPLGGWLIDLTGSAAAPIWLAGAVLVAGLPPLAAFRLRQRAGYRPA